MSQKEERWYHDEFGYVDPFKVFVVVISLFLVGVGVGAVIYWAYHLLTMTPEERAKLDAEYEASQKMTGFTVVTDLDTVKILHIYDGDNGKEYVKNLESQGWKITESYYHSDWLSHYTYVKLEKTTSISN